MIVPSAVEIAKRFVKYAPVREDRFEEGVKNPKRDWAKSTLAAEGNYEESIRKSITRKAFGKGVTKCGTAKQQAKTIANLPRWREGIEGAETEMAEKMAPVVAVLESIKLPVAYPKGDPRNLDRVKVITQGLRKAKEEGRI